MLGKEQKIGEYNIHCVSDCLSICGENKYFGFIDYEVTETVILY